MALRRAPIALIALVAASADLSCGRSERGKRSSPTAGSEGGFPEAGAGSGGTAGNGPTGGARTGGAPTGGSRPGPTGGTAGGVGGSGGVGPGDGGESGADADGGREGFDFDCLCTTCTAPFEYCHLYFIDEDTTSRVEVEASCESVPAQCENDYSCGCFGGRARGMGSDPCYTGVSQLPAARCVGDAQDGVSVWVPGP